MINLLEEKLKKNIFGTTVIVGIGNILKGDDGVGSIVAERLIESTKLNIIDAGVSLENYAGPIVKIKPDTVILIDAVDLEKKPGAVEIIQTNDFSIMHFSTHGLSLKFFINYLCDQGINNVIIIGIQPETFDLGSNVSKAVETSAKEIENIIKMVINF